MSSANTLADSMTLVPMTLVPKSKEYSRTVRLWPASATRTQVIRFKSADVAALSEHLFGLKEIESFTRSECKR